MNFNKDLFEKSEAKEYGERTSLELGGHEVVIMDAREYTSEISGNTSLKVSIDIGPSDKQAGYFKRQFDENTAVDKKWSTSAIRYLSLKDESISYLKGFITALEKSNSAFKFNPNGTWDQLKSLKCAGVFSWEEYEDSEGKIRTATKLTNFRSLDKLPEITIPKVKLIDGTYVDYEDYVHNYLRKDDTSTPKETKGLFDNEVEITPDQIPFE